MCRHQYFSSEEGCLICELCGIRGEQILDYKKPYGTYREVRLGYRRLPRFFHFINQFPFTTKQIDVLVKQFHHIENLWNLYSSAIPRVYFFNLSYICWKICDHFLNLDMSAQYGPCIVSRERLAMQNEIFQNLVDRKYTIPEKPKPPKEEGFDWDRVFC